MLNVVIRKKNAQCSNDGETQPDGVTGDGWWLVSMFGMQRCCFHDAMQEENNVILAKVITPLGLDRRTLHHVVRARSKARLSCVAARTFNGGGNPINNL